jgi:tetratricopeptide (TPR) repeat protein
LEEIKLSTEHYQKALNLNPKYAASLSGIGLIYQYRAEYLISVGEDPSESFKEAISYRERTVKSDSKNADMMNNLGNTYDEYASYLINSGGSPEEPNRRAIETFQEAIRMNPKDPLLQSNLIGSFITRIRYLQMMGQDYSSELLKCIRAAEENIAVNAHHELSRYALLDSYLLQVRYEIDHKTLPESSLDKAQETVEMILRDAVETDVPHGYLGEIDLLIAKANVLKKKSPEQNLKSAVEHLNKALEQSPMDQSALLLMAECYLESAEWKHSIRKPVTSDVEAGLNIAQMILRKNPRNADAFVLIAKLELTRSNSARVREASEKALQLNRNLEKQISHL